MSIGLRLITFKTGARPGSAPLAVVPQRLVVLVGPNNSGKTKALMELSELCTALGDSTQVVVQRVDITPPNTADEILSMLRRFEVKPEPNQRLGSEDFLIRRPAIGFATGRATQNFVVSRNLAKSWLLEPDQQSLKSIVLPAFLLGLDGPNRFTMIGRAPIGNLQLPPENHLAALFRDDKAREHLRQLIYDTFGIHLVIDPTSEGGTLELKVSDKPPADSRQERSLDDTAIQFFRTTIPLNVLGDGVKAFVGILAPLIAADYGVVLLDEPEAFLHPPQARRLGSYLADIANDRGASIVVATHGADFLMGCLEKDAEHITIVRVTFSQGAATARALQSTDIVPMFRDPLLRSTGLLNAMFHQSAVVAESDGDRSFYEEINRRLGESQRGIKDCVFLNAQNKQTVQRLVSPLRKIGIPAAAVVDLDFLRVSNASEWPGLLQACGVPPSVVDTLDMERAYVVGRFAAVPPCPDGKDPLKAFGLSALPTTDRARAETLLKQLANYGIFLVPGGELESWLPALGVHEKKVNWCIKIFERLGQDPAQPSYVKPATDDVWLFLDTMSKWVEDPNRAGML